MSSATQPTRRLWHSSTGALWASSAAAGDVESAPTNGETVAGHVQGTAYTSGRANWLWAAAAEWLQKVRDVMLPQHDDAGGHWQLTVTGGAGATKILVTANASDVSSDYIVKLRDPANDVAFVVRADGRVLRKRTVPLGPADFQPISHKNSTMYDEWTMSSNGNVGDFGGGTPDSTSRYLQSIRIELQEGEVITSVSIAGNKTDAGQTIEGKLHSKDWDNAYGAATAVHATQTCAASTGDLTASSTGLSVTGSNTKVFWLRVELNDNSTGAAILRGAKIEIGVV